MHIFIIFDSNAHRKSSSPPLYSSYLSECESFIIWIHRALLPLPSRAQSIIPRAAPHLFSDMATQHSQAEDKPHWRICVQSEKNKFSTLIHQEKYLETRFGKSTNEILNVKTWFYINFQNLASFISVHMYNFAGHCLGVIELHDCMLKVISIFLTF